MYQDIPIELLMVHPENSNRMSNEMLAKLRKHIEQTGRYEPLTVRPHPEEKTKYQVINGHNRLRVLRNLNHQIVHCIVWNIDDNQTRLYLATLNRLSGSEVSERRAALLENLLEDFDSQELLSLLPDNEKQIEELKRLSCIEPDCFKSPATITNNFSIPVIIDFIIDESEAREVNLALDLILNRENDLSRSRALVYLARFYLENCHKQNGAHQ